MNPAFDPRPPLRILSAHDVRFVIIGGIAGVLLGSPSLTRNSFSHPLHSRNTLAALGPAQQASRSRDAVKSPMS